MRMSGRIAVYVVTGLLMLLHLSLVPAVPVSAASTWYVDDDCSDPGDGSQGDPFCTIQEAIDAAVGGDTVMVAPGTYAGAIVDKSVKILGAPDGTSVITSGVPHKVGSTLYTAFRPFGDDADGAEIRNFTINCNVLESFSLGVYAVEVDDIVVASVIIHDTMQGISNWGGSNWEITDNRIYGTVAMSGGGIGIFLGAKSQQTCCGNLVRDNVVDATATAETYSCPGICLCLDTRYGQYENLDGTEDISGNLILSNDITASGVNNGVGIEVGTILGDSENDPDRNDPDLIAAIMSAGAVHDNVVKGNTIYGPYEGVYFYNVTGLTITQNTIENCVNNGIYVEHGHSGVAIYCNNIVGSANYGIENQTETTVNAINNWWGDSRGPGGEGPGYGDAVTAYVDYDPWLYGPWQVTPPCGTPPPSDGPIPSGGEAVGITVMPVDRVGLVMPWALLAGLLIVATGLLLVLKSRMFR